jgi:hypothetical protein
MRRRPGTPRHCRGATCSESYRGLASGIDAPEHETGPEALTGQLKRSTTATMNITSYGWSAR